MCVQALLIWTQTLALEGASLLSRLLSLVLAPPKPKQGRLAFPPFLHTPQSTRHNNHGTIASLVFASHSFLRRAACWTRGRAKVERSSQGKHTLVASKKQQGRRKIDARLAQVLPWCRLFQRPAPSHPPVLANAAEGMERRCCSLCGFGGETNDGNCLAASPPNLFRFAVSFMPSPHPLLLLLLSTHTGSQPATPAAAGTSTNPAEGARGAVGCVTARGSG